MVNLLVHLFLPRHTNNHRAKALHIDALLLYVIGFLVYQVSTTWVHASYPDVLGYATDIRVEELLVQTNARRKDAGLTTLVLNEKLSEAAAGKARDMFAKNYWAHTSPDGKLPWDFITGAGYKYTVAGENLAKNFNDSTGVVTAWMSSSSHRDNMMKPSYRDIGFAVVNGTINGEETTLVVQMFGAAASAPLAQAPQPIVKEVSASEPTTKPLSGPISNNIPSAQPVVISEQALGTEQKPFYKTQRASFQLLEYVSKPLVNLSSVNRTIPMLFIGFLLGVSFLDLYLTHKKKIVRVAGHTHAHILFLTLLMVLLMGRLPGSVL